MLLRKSSQRKAIAFIGVGFLLTASFQNCSQTSTNGSPQVSSQSQTVTAQQLQMNFPSTNVNLTTSQTATITSAFQKYLYSFPLPAGSLQWTGLSGSVSLQLLSGRWSEALMSVWYNPTGTCPTNGTMYLTYPDIQAAFPNMVPLENLIVKQPTVGTSTVTVNESLPVPVPISGCLVVIMDGGPPAGTATIKMSSNLVLSYTTNNAPSSVPYLVGLGGEFCFGQNWGCQAATTSPNESFSYAIPAPRNSQLLALLGDFSYSTFDGQSPYGALPNGVWTMNLDAYILPGGCGAFPTGPATGANNNYAMLPANAVHLFNRSMSGNGLSTLQSPVFQTFTNVGVNAGDCLLTLTQMTGANGGVDAETQVEMLLQPVVSSAPTPAPSPAPAPASAPAPAPASTPSLSSLFTRPIYRLFNGTDHLYSVSQTEGTTSGYHYEEEAFLLAPSSGSGLVPLYRCLYSKGHFLSTQSNCEGETVEGVLGYMSSANAGGLTPLYRFVNSAGYHLETTVSSEGTSNGYTLEGTLGYVLP